MLAIYGYEQEEIIALNHRTIQLSACEMKRIIIFYYPFADRFGVITCLVKMEKSQTLPEPTLNFLSFFLNFKLKTTFNELEISKK